MSVTETENLSAEIVADYLQQHPDFFLGRPELVDRLSLVDQQQGAISLVEIKMRRQRQRITELEEEITSFMSLAASNDRTFHQLMALQQQLLTCDSLPVLQSVLNQHAQQMGLQAHLLLLEQGAKPLTQETYQRFMADHLNGKEAYLGRLNRQDRYVLFGQMPFGDNQMSELGSYVILPLYHQQALGLLAFSSQQGGHFQPSMDTLFLRHLASLVSYLLVQLVPQIGLEEESASMMHSIDSVSHER